MSDSPPHSAGGLKAPPPGCLHVRCAECFAILMVGPGMSEFICPRCQLAQRLPPEMIPLLGPSPGERPRAQGIDPTKLQLPCASCKAILNVPYGLTRFKCPQCDSDLSMDPSQFPMPPPNPPLLPPPPSVHPGVRHRPLGIPLLPPSDVPPPQPDPEEINEVVSDSKLGK